jgi:hypothetical protein
MGEDGKEREESRYVSVSEEKINVCDILQFRILHGFLFE